MLILCLSYFIITVPSCKRLKQNYSIFFLRSNFQKKKSRHLYFYIQYTYMAWNSYMWKWVGCLNNLKRSRFSSKNSKLQQGLLWIFSSVWSAAALLQLCSGLCHLLLLPSKDWIPKKQTKVYPWFSMVKYTENISFLHLHIP